MSGEALRALAFARPVPIGTTMASGRGAGIARSKSGKSGIVATGSGSGSGDRNELTGGRLAAGGAGWVEVDVGPKNTGEAGAGGGPGVGAAGSGGGS